MGAEFAALPIRTMPAEIMRFLIYLMLLIISTASYIYFSFAVARTARRLGVKDSWRAWIPYVGKPWVMSKAAKEHWWPVPAAFATVVFLGPLNIALSQIREFGAQVANFFLSLLVDGAIIMLVGYMVYWTWIICEERKRPGWWSLPGALTFISTALLFLYWPAGAYFLVLVSFLGQVWLAILWGILAWKKK